VAARPASVGGGPAHLFQTTRRGHAAAKAAGPPLRVERRGQPAEERDEEDDEDEEEDGRGGLRPRFVRAESKLGYSAQLIHDAGSSMTTPRPSVLNFVPSALQITSVGMPRTPKMELNSSLRSRLSYGNASQGISVK